MKTFEVSNARLRTIFVRDFCNICARGILAWLKHTINSSIENWIDIIHGESGDPRVNWIVKFAGVDSAKDLVRRGYLPAGIEDNVIWNFVRGSKWQYYFWLKNNKDYLEGWW